MAIAGVIVIVVPPGHGVAMVKFGTALVVFFMLGFATTQFANKPWYWQDIFWSRDQQGQWYFSQQQYHQAANRFEHPHWRATALYAGQQFSAAAQLWSQQPGAVALFNRGNALAHIEDYAAAADSYDLALQLKPGWAEAKANLDLVRVLSRTAEVEVDESEAGNTQLEADEIVFDLNQQTDVKTQVVDQSVLSAEEIQALWLRRLQTKPADFLRLKFQYQLHSEAQP